MSLMMGESMAEKAMKIIWSVCLIVCLIFICIIPILAIYIPFEIASKIAIIMLCVMGVLYLVGGIFFCVAIQNLEHRGER